MKIRELSKFINNIESQFDDFKNSVSTLDKKVVDLQKLRVIITNVNTEFKQITNDIWKNFDNWCQYVHFQKHKEYIDPIVDACK